MRETLSTALADLPEERLFELATERNNTLDIHHTKLGYHYTVEYLGTHTTSSHFATSKQAIIGYLISDDTRPQEKPR